MPERRVFVVEKTYRAKIHAATPEEASQKFDSPDKGLTNPEPKVVRVDVEASL